MAAYELIQKKLEKRVAKIIDDPEQWLAARQELYKNLQFKHDGRYRAFDTGFFLTQLNRGVFASDDEALPTHPWWSKFKRRFIFYCELSLQLQDQSAPKELPEPAKRWLKFFKKPSGKSWFKAFNTTLLVCADECRADALSEDEVEQVYINALLYRMMFAQVMVEQPELFDKQAKEIKSLWSFDAKAVGFNPQEAAVVDTADGLIELDDALDEQVNADLEEQLEEKLESVGVAIFGHGAETQSETSDEYDEAFVQKVEQLDNEVILPHLTTIFEHVAKWNNLPFIESWCRDGKAVYPAV